MHTLFGITLVLYLLKLSAGKEFQLHEVYFLSPGCEHGNEAHTKFCEYLLSIPF